MLSLISDLKYRALVKMREQGHLQKRSNQFVQTDVVVA